VDDEQVVRFMGSEILKELGYRVTGVEDGEKAVEYYRDHFKEVDLAIIDLVMPKLGGLECYLGLKEINPAVKALVSSGYTVDGEAGRILEAGAKGFLQKPFDIKQLSVMVYQAIME
jgi:CheY-like chemotaxis protein